LAPLTAARDDTLRLDALCTETAPDAIELRRTLHRHPELSWQETRTQALLEERLRRLGLDPAPVAKTGLVVDIGSGDRMVLYRADMDALPIQDGKDGSAVAVSGIGGISHACGHDLHMAVAYGLARIFAASASALPGRVRIVFQPAEEVIPSGAEALVREGVARGALAAIALHADPVRTVGRLGVRHGPMTACGDSFYMKVSGVGGHSSRPYLARDPILAAARVVESIHTLVPQRVDPLEPAVLAVGSIRGGSAPNVIAGEVNLSGTLRTFSEEVRRFLHGAIAETASAAAATQGCSAEVRIDEGAPSLHNHPEIDAIFRRCAVEALGEGGIEVIERPSTGGEDFSFFGLEAPTYMARLGVRNPERPVRHLHTAEFEPDEGAIEVALKVMSRVLLTVLEEAGPRG
jgi:amidohydrolase